ncbi:MAG: hypothetical protein S4CHLAM123_02890 [Chlamydiales bacterium]|nr:hypothetical protein [Chlamydiales bacterium]
MKPLHALFALLFAFAPLTSHAHCGQFYGAFDTLYWQPSHVPVVAGRQIGPDGGGLRPRENLLINGEYDWGVRGQIGYERCEFFVDLAYLYFNTETTSHFTAAPGSVIRMPASADLQSLQSDLDWRYQNIDLRCGHSIFRTRCTHLYGYGNARWVDILFANLDTGVRTTPAAQPDTYSQKTTFNGGGLGVGIGAQYHVLCGLGLRGQLGLMSIIGTLDPKIELFEADTGNSSLRVDEDPRSCIIPALEFRFGLEYAFCLCLFKLSTEIGYELDTYFDTIRHNIGIDRDGVDDVVQLTYYNAGFGGPYFRLSARY